MPKSMPRSKSSGDVIGKDMVSRSWASGQKRLGPFHPSWLFIGFFILLIGLGTLALSLPGAAADGVKALPLDAFFTATSAATGTGLAVQDTITFWSANGQRVVLALMFVGGLGSLIGTTLLILIIAGKVNKQEQFLLKASTGVDSSSGIKMLGLGITLYVLLAQGIGAYLLGSQLSMSMSTGDALWLGIFESVSAFNNAGFDLLGISQTLPDTSIQLILACLSFIGSISFIIIVDLVRSPFRRKLALDSRVVLIGSFLLLAVGMGAVLISEGNNPQTLGPMAPAQKVVSAFFHSAAARTGGLSTVNLAAFAYPTLLLIMALMFIGGSAGSNASGIKVNTFAVLASVTWSFIRGQRHVHMMGSSTRVHDEQMYRAMAIAFLSAALVFVVMLVLSVTEPQSLLADLFETVSAYSTTGFSMGITPSLSDVGKILIAFTMFAGRVGPITLAFALSVRRPTFHAYTEEAINMG